MAEKEKNQKTEQQNAENNEQELDLDQLEQFSGGTLGNARRSQTSDITDSVAQRF